ncbi:MAG: thermonuclease family protein [Myxococcaceae bacterium]|jgi:micrococcal nuclease|nr:thermonuclease family protein [Myxococcaceae bacterium]MCA3016725.1 thermonuclease family protein [Myxococcaceae bacterium]
MRAPGAVVTWLALAACSAPTPPSVCGPSSAIVKRAIDGDTLELTDGRRVRLLLVDTPETTGGKMDCFGAQAVQFTSERVTGQMVELTYDERGCTDRFGRTLAYVKVGGVELNRALVEQGYACTLYVSPAGSSRRDEFETYESQAKTSRLGVWGACTVVTCD